MTTIVASRRFQSASRLFLISSVVMFFVLACAQNQNVSVETPHIPAKPPPRIQKNSQYKTPTPQHPVTVDGNAGVKKQDSAFSDDPNTEEMLRNEYSRWLGTKHRLGGTDRNGIDCSGFVKTVYRNVFGIDLPRTTVGQVKQGRQVAFQDMRIGDLVFFKPPDYRRHVGIYLGKSEFVHASKTSGVTVSSIDRYYWKPHFWTARRILTD